MSIAQAREPLSLPAGLQTQLHGFRRRVWTIKMAEAAGAAVFVVMLAFLCVFALDRLWDTPRWLRFGVWTAAMCGCAIVPLQLHRWIWRQRRLEQLARLLTAKLPRLGDQLLGIIELVHSKGEQARSRALCEAAVRCVARDAEKCNLDVAAPSSRHRAWAAFAVVLAAAAVGLGVVVPRRGRQCLGAISLALGRDASLHVRRRRATARGDRRSPRRAVRSFGAIGSRLALASSARPGPTRRAAAGAIAAGRRPLPLRIAGAD